MVESEFNPYAASAETTAAVRGAGIKAVDEQELLAQLQKFRRGMHVLGGFWLVLGAMRLAYLGVQLKSDGLAGMVGIALLQLLPLLFVPLGCGVLAKNMLSVRVALWLFLALSLSVVQSLGFAEVLIIIAFAWMVFRKSIAVLGQSRMLTDCGIPLTARMEDVLSLAPQTRTGMTEPS